LIMLVIALGFTQALSSHIVDFYRAINRTHISSALAIVRAVMNLGAGYAALAMDLDVGGVLAAFVFADALLGLAVLCRIYWAYPASRARAAFEGLAPFLRFGLPLVPYTLLVGANAVSDRYFITHMLDVAEAGRYALSYGLVSAAMLVGSAIGYVIYPQLSLLWTQNDHAGLKAMLAEGQAILLYLTVPIACGLTLVYPGLIQLLAGGHFVLDRKLIALLALGHLFLGLCGVEMYLVELAAGTGMTLASLVGASVANLALNLLLIPPYGLTGAAAATCLTYAAQWLIVKRFAYVLVRFNVTVAPRLLVTTLVGASAMALLVVLAAPSAPLANLIVSIGVGAVSYLGVTSLVAGRDGRSRLLTLLSGAGGRRTSVDAAP